MRICPSSRKRIRGRRHVHKLQWRKSRGSGSIFPRCGQHMPEPRRAVVTGLDHEGRLRAFPHALPLPAPQRDGGSPHSATPPVEACILRGGGGPRGKSHVNRKTQPTARRRPLSAPRLFHLGNACQYKGSTQAIVSYEDSSSRMSTSTLPWTRCRGALGSQPGSTRGWPHMRSTRLGSEAYARTRRGPRCTRVSTSSRTPPQAGHSSR